MRRNPYRKLTPMRSLDALLNLERVAGAGLVNGACVPSGVDRVIVMLREHIQHLLTAKGRSR